MEERKPTRPPELGKGRAYQDGTLTPCSGAEGEAQTEDTSALEEEKGNTERHLTSGDSLSAARSVPCDTNTF